jgi:hypothetical protein
MSTKLTLVADRSAGRRLGSRSSGGGGLAGGDGGGAIAPNLARMATQHSNSRQQRITIILDDVVEFPEEGRSLLVV